MAVRITPVDPGLYFVYCHSPKVRVITRIDSE